MNIIDLIEKKKLKKELTEEEFDFFINEYIINKTIPDYQVSALLMAFNINGMSDDEIYYLTKIFIKYSKTMEFDHLNNDYIIDKHSSGGVGDKISIILIPILTSLGFNVPKISGRSLGYTGGTIDKLDSINTITNLSFDEAKKIYSKNKCVIFQQTEDFVPADRKIYALRDVTSTTDTIGLIVASILSKKFIINSDYIFIDLKVGDGALMQTVDDAIKLSNSMLYVANKLKRKLCISLTRMNQPLGWKIGNFLEISESIDFLKGINQCADLKELIYDIVYEILSITKKVNSRSESDNLVDEVIISQKAYQNFINWLSSQHADISKIENYQTIKAKYSLEIFAKESGYLNILSAKKIALISLELGAGRINKDTKIDFLAGIEFLKKTNDYVKEGELIAILHSDKPIPNEINDKFYDQICINNKKIPLNNIIIKTLSNL